MCPHIGIMCFFNVDLDPETLRNWRKNKPNLYKIIMLGFAFEEVVERSKITHEELEELRSNIDK
jgi:hypothetical protein